MVGGSFGQTGVGCPPQLRWKGLVCVHSSGCFPSDNGGKDPIGSPTAVPSVPGHPNPDPTWDEKGVEKETQPDVVPMLPSEKGACGSLHPVT